MKKIIAIFTVLISFNLLANEAAVARFDRWFSVLEKDFSVSSNPEKVADSLLKGMSRVASFNLQALGKIYRDYDKGFKKLRKDFKGLEDGIGKYDMWNKVLKAAYERNASSSKIRSIKKKRSLAKDALEELLVEREWMKGKRLKKYKRYINEVGFASYQEDKSFVAEHLADSLVRLDETDFDLHALEEGNGVHEWRREMRWFLIKARVLGGLIQFKENPNKCEVSRYRRLPFQPIAESKYSSLDSSELEKDPCRISQCLFLALVQKVSQVGDLKDDIEQELNLRDTEGEDETPESFLPELRRLYSEYKRYNAVSALEKQLRSCQ